MTTTRNPDRDTSGRPWRRLPTVRLERLRPDLERLRPDFERLRPDSAQPPMPPRPKNAAQALPDNLPPALRVGAAVSWRLIIIAAAIYVLWLVTQKLIDLVLPIGIALLLAALLSPAVSRLVRSGVPRALATAIVIVFGLSVVGGMLTFVIIQFANGMPELRTQVSEAIDQINVWLSTGPLQLSDTQLQTMLDNARNSIQGNEGEVAGHVLDTALTLGKVLASLVLMLFALIFFLYDGDRIWRFLTHLSPRVHRDRVDVAGRRGFAALVSYIRATVVVAVIDAVFVGIGLAIVGVPLAVPLSALIFLGAFVPILGAFVTGAVAVLIALVAKGVLAAVVVLCILVAVLNIEGHVLQPLLLGRAVQIHPLAVVLTIGVGLTVAGIPGALLAVPLLAVLNASIRSLLAPEDDHVDPEEIDVNADESADPAPAPAAKAL